MYEKICVFCGHRNLITDKLEKQIEIILYRLIRDQGYNVFYSGHMGDFDELCESTIRKLKKKYNGIKLCRILYYYRCSKEDDNFLFDETILPDLSGIHYKRAITERNFWMVERADMVLCYVYKDYGGAYTMMKHAEKKKKTIVNTYTNFQN